MQRPLLALRSLHGDFEWYQRRFDHEDAKLTCTYGRVKTPEHLALYRLTKRRFRRWPSRPSTPPGNRREAFLYLRSLTPGDAQLLQITNFYTWYGGVNAAPRPQTLLLTHSFSFLPLPLHTFPFVYYTRSPSPHLTS
ncbi:hypothetical protein PENPOL_c002G03051 [Penicillium polonicum]|uniref:Uncharacterized protein n=1 Tax=Penicillium polonicum TaxID=60169 RepID=A0A1V6NY29_PENPO|nr:hypothetical protein PENPOL_c002G03051 [Penicillium polonicum]